MAASWFGGTARLASLVRFAPLVACAGVLTTSLPAAAQDAEPTPPAEGSTEAAAPAEGTPEAAATPAEGSAEASATGEVSAEEAALLDPDTEMTEEELGAVTDEIVVTGFRYSLGAALNRKQRATGQVDAIVAEDIADFPDLNLAESLQRIPGVSISRTYGEGQQITVRGLSGLYTRVRINGIESRAAVGNNTGRNFDFSVFASELFNSIVVHKTASADLDEGSLGAVVDLNTARAFNYDEGFTFVAGATGAYNDLSQTVRPRLTGLAAYRDPADVWGATASIAYSATRSDSATAETVRWQRGPFRSVNGVVCADNPGDPGCTAVNDTQHPRIPRYGEEVNTNSRLGMTAGLQFKPTDVTEVRLDGLYALYNQLNDRRWLEVLFRGNEPGFDITGYRIQNFPERYDATNNSLVAADVNNAWVRSERNPIDLESRFYQLTLALDHRFTDNFYVNAVGGITRSKGTSNDATVDYDMRTYNGFSFDYGTGDAEYPLLAYRGADVNDAANWQVTELRDRYATTLTGFDTAELDVHYDIVDQFKLATGINYKRATLDTKASNRDGLVCNLEELDFECDAANGILGPSGEAALSDAIHYPGEVGAGSNTRWAAPALDPWFERIGYDNVPLAPDQDGTYKVTEKNLGTYLQAKGEVMLGVGDMRLNYDAGVRYVQTRQSSTGYNSGVLVTINRPMYDDWLPSVNAALWFTEEVVLRLAAAQVMSRPTLANLSPGGTVDSFNFAINNQNPFLDPTRATALDASAEWYFADASVLSLALFYKDIDSFPIRSSRTGTFASTQLPRSVIQGGSPADVSGPAAEGTCGVPEGCWEISELTNGPGASLKGLEVGFQAPFSALSSQLPVIIRSLGVVANYTFVDSEVDYNFLDTPITERLLGLSNGSYNATLYYDDSVFNARFSLAYRSDFLLAGPNSAANLWEYSESDTRLDFSSGYNINEHLKISFEAINLLNTPSSNTKVDVDAERRNLYAHTGRSYLLGARFSY